MISTDGIWFKDDRGRTLILRGVNLGGSTKVPFSPNGATYIKEGFFNHRDVSFIGRPFPLEEADEHFSRLREWGLTFLRFLVTWEAIEHSGPGLYDEAYLNYLYGIVKKAGEYGFLLFIDPHQDVWSRFSGGDGAPGWTFEAVGMDMRKFDVTGAAITHQIHGDPLPRMIWPTNEQKLAAATMFTLFFGGNDFAPSLRIDGEPVQEYLQGHYLNAVKQVAERLKGLPHVVGYDTLNEPSAGYIGWSDLLQPGGLMKIGPSPSPFQSMLLGAGYPQEVDAYEVWVLGGRQAGSVMLNEGGERVWMPGHDCIWHQNGIWDLDVSGEPHLLRPDYFTHRDGHPIDFTQDYYLPFARRYTETIHTEDPKAMIFTETEFNHDPPHWNPDEDVSLIWAPHWYDGYIVLLKNYRSLMAADTQKGSVVFGSGRIRRSFADQIGSLKKAPLERMGSVPTLIGEFGIAYDLKKKDAYRTGDFSAQIKAMDRSFKAMEDNLVNCTLWNYTADNSNERGDQWNDEDFSIFSRDQQSNPDDIHSGGRALEAVVRPYAMRVAGEPLRMAFDYKRRVFEFEFRHDPQVKAPTEFFVPNFQYPN